MLSKAEYYSRRDNPSKQWQRNFVECAQMPGPAASWVQKGVEKGLAQDNYQSRRQLARQMGAVFASAFDPATGGEKRLPELDLSEASKLSRVPAERLQKVGEHMVACGALKGERKVFNLIAK